MVTATLDDVRTESALIDLVKDVPIAILAPDGTPGAILVSADFYERALDALEDAADIRAAAAARNEPGESIPWKLVRTNLNLQ